MKTTLVLTVAALSLAATLGAAERKPNVLVILADDLGYGELGCQGFNQDVPTPNIDSIAKGGTRFTNGYVTGAVCSPTRAGFMTGKYQTRFGHEFNQGIGEKGPPNFGLSLEEKTIGDRMRAAGYSTGWFGKSHLGFSPQFHPLLRGFDVFYGFLGGAHDYFEADSEHYGQILDGTTPVPKIDYTTDVFTQQAAAFITKNKDRPWFCYLPYNAVHGPLQAGEKYTSRFPKITDQKRKKFCGMLSAMDDGIGLLLGKIREQKQEEDTLIIFFSDNGGPTSTTSSNNGPLRGFKGQTWEGGIRIPFLVQWKGHLPEGKIDDRPVIQLDLLPTVLAAVGVVAAPDWQLDGVNLLPYLKGENKAPPHEALCWRYGQQAAIRLGDYKLVKAVGMEGVEPDRRATKATMDGGELYNLKDDIGESKNLAGQQPDRVKELAAAWTQWDRGNIDPKWGPTGGKGKKGDSAGE